MRGSIMLTAALWLALVITTLGVIDVSHVWWQRRTLQGVADMASLAGAQRLDDTCGTTGTGPQTVVKQNAVANGYAGALTVTCGRYNLSTQMLGSGTPFNAVNVALNTDVNYWFLSMLNASQGKSVNVAAQSTSRVTNVGMFTLATGLASVQSGQSALLNGLLSGLLGGTVNLNLGTYQTLANTQIKLGDLALALGANDVTSMLALPPPAMSTLIAKLGSVAGKTSAAASSALAGLVPVLSGVIGSKSIPLNGASSAGLLDVGLANKNAALNATVNVLDALLVAAQIANVGSTVTTPISALTTLDTRLIGSTIGIKITQPPVLAVGEAGKDSSGNWRTEARSSQIALLINLAINVPLVANFNLPLYVGVANGTADLTQTQCGAGASDSGSFMTVTPGVAEMCLGGVAAAMYAGAPVQCTKNGKILDVLGGVTSLYGYADVKLSPPPMNIAFTGVGHSFLAPNPVVVNSNNVGRDFTSAINTLSTSLLSSLSISLLGGALDPVTQLVLQPVLNLLATTVFPATGGFIAPLLSGLVPPLLDLLGAQIGTNTVTNLSLTCGNVQLVN